MMVGIRRSSDARMRAPPPIANSGPDSASRGSNQREWPLASIADLHPFAAQAAVKLLGLICGMVDIFLTSGFVSSPSNVNLLKAGMKITAYQLHDRSFSPETLID
jgi:hypothetical protein